MGQLTSFDINQYFLVAAGERILGGADGDFFEVSIEGQDWEFSRGSTGEAMRTANPAGQGAVVTVNFRYGGSGVEVLERLREAGEPFNFTGTDNNGGGGFSCPNAYIEGRPNYTIGPQTGPVSYSIRCPDFQSNLSALQRV